MDLMTASDFLTNSTTPAPSAWMGYLLVAIAGGIGYAGFGLMTKDRSLSNFGKDFAWGAVGMLAINFVLSYFFHVRLPWFDS